MKKLLILLFLFIPSLVFGTDVHTFAALTTPSSTTGVNVGDNQHHIIQYTVTGISTNVVVRAEGSLDNSSWANLASDGSDTTKTANGTYFLYIDNVPIKYIRLTYVSKSGTGGSIASKYRGKGVLY